MAGLAILSAVHARGRAAAATGDGAWLRGMLAFEGALAEASAEAGLLPVAHAEAITAAAHALAADLDPAAIGAEAGRIGNPAGPLVAALTDAVRTAAPEAAGDVHRGATSQDVVDTAAMLVARHAVAALLDDLVAAADRSGALAQAHRDDVIAGRTLLQQATPTTFGAKAAGWTAGLDAAAADLRAVRAALPVQLGGATGTLSGLGDAGPDVAVGVARRLGLAEPLLPWHTSRTPITRLAGALGTAAGAVGTIARDVTLLAQTEVGEVHEAAPERGGSTAMPHKRNPVAAVCALGGAGRAPGLVATLLQSATQEHERAAGAWHAEWEALDDLLRVTGSAGSWLRESLETLEVDPARMRANLDAKLGLPLAEHVVAALAGHVDRDVAHALVGVAARTAAVDRRPLADVLADTDEVVGPLGRDGIDRALDPTRATGAAGAFVDRVLEARHTAPGGGDHGSEP